MKQFWLKTYPLVTGALIFMIFALYNGYPIVSGDTGAYIDSSLSLKAPDARPLFYGLFIAITSLSISAWGTVFIQCFILSYVCIRFISGLVAGISRLHLLAILLLISLCTISGWYASQLLPDVFTPILFLSVYIYLLLPNSRWQKVLLLTIIFLSIAVHYSHYMIAAMFFSLLWLASFISKTHLGHIRFRVIHLLTVTIIAWLSLFTSNFMSGKGFTFSNNSHVFLMGKLNESGVLTTYLDKACPLKQYKICAYKDDMPAPAWEFVWDGQHSPVFKTGGPEANRQEYNAIIRDILSRPKYWPFLAYKSAEATLRQVILLNIDEGEERYWIKTAKKDPLFATIKKAFPSEANEFLLSRQNIKTLNIVFYDDVFVIVFLLSTLLCAFGLGRDILTKAGLVYFLVVVFVFVNAFTTASFCNVLSRLNSRTIWLLPMLNMIFIYISFTQRFIRGKASPPCIV